MKIVTRVILVFSCCGALLATAVDAASWRDHLDSASKALQQNGGEQSGNLSLSSLTDLLKGGNESLSSGSMTNAAGILQYCIKDKVLGGDSGTIKDKLLSKLGLSNNNKTSQKQDYQQGLKGVLSPGKGKEINLNSLGNTDLANKVKTKACELVLKQGKQFIL